MYRELERLSGTGIVRKSDGSVIGSRTYAFTISQHVLDVGHGERIPGTPQIQGRVGVTADEGANFIMTSAELVLTLEDGRTFPFFLTTSDGRVAARGPLK